MTNKPNGGAIGYISASSLAFIGINNAINTAVLNRIFEDRVLELGQALALAKMGAGETTLLTQASTDEDLYVRQLAAEALRRCHP